MSHGKLREDKTCLNCGHQVEERYCPNCGQENTETKKPFHYLFTHFVEDFTHYDGQFWGTIKNLLFKPGKLTNVYLSGKRQQFVPPVKLYIFVSFITFFLFAVVPIFNVNLGNKVTFKVGGKNGSDSISGNVLKDEIIKNIREEKAKQTDSVEIEKLNKAEKAVETTNNISQFQDLLVNDLEANKTLDENDEFAGFKTREEYDKANKSSSWLKNALAHKFFELKEQGVKRKDIIMNLWKTSFHNLPKALFIYLPIFAFFMWVFHNKKKWWYFDHGVFTLHYFSFLLVVILLTILTAKLFNLIGDYTAIEVISGLFILGVTFYSFVYFFLAHHNVYKSHGVISALIGGIIFFFNFIAFTFLMIGLAFVSFLTMH